MLAGAARADSPWHAHDPASPVRSVGLAACYEPKRSDTVWDAVLADAPDVFVFLGDNVYADSRDVGELRAAWAELTGKRWFTELTARSHVLATWDDHDFGENDGGRTYPAREASQRAFLDAFREPVGSERRRTPGVYDAVTLGPEGQRTQFVLLDTRYFRDDLVHRGAVDRDFTDGRSGAYEPNPDPEAQILGDEQWAWLERTLAEPAELRVIVSSIQVLTTDHAWESWSLFPHERRRLVSLIDGAGPAVIVSGDRHKSEVSRTLPGETDGVPLHELTVGSVNKPVAWLNEINDRRVGSIYFGATVSRLEIEWTSRGPVVGLVTLREGGEVAFAHLVDFTR